MSNDKQNFVYIGEDAGFIQRFTAVAANAVTMNASTIVLGKEPPKHPTMAFDEKKKPPKTIELNSGYLRVVEIVAVMTVLLWTAYGAMAIWGPNTDAVHTASATFSHFASLGFGAIVGLIGGKSGFK